MTAVGGDFVLDFDFLKTVEIMKKFVSLTKIIYPL